MNNLQKLRAERDRISATANTLAEKYPKNQRMSADDAIAIDVILDRVQEIDAEIRAEVERAQGIAPADTMRGADGQSVKVLRTAADFRAHYRQAGGAGIVNGAESFGLADFLRGVAGMKAPTSVQAALSEGTNSAGGYSVPNVLMPGILESLAPVSSLMVAGAGIVPLDVGGKDFTTAAVQTIPTAAWRNEGAAISESDPVFRGITATPRSLSFMFKVSRELLADAANIQAGLYRAIAQSFAKELDRAGLRGTGTAPEPRGLLNTVGIQSVTNGANGASIATTAYANFVSALQSLLAADAPQPTAAIMAPRSLTTLAGLLDTTNQPRRAPPVIEQWQFAATSQIPTNLTVGTSTDCSEIYVGDFRLFNIMLRENVSIQLLKERFADTGQIGFVAHVRADFSVLYPAAFAVVTGVRA